MGNSQPVTFDMARAALDDIFDGFGTEESANLLRAVADLATLVKVQRSDLQLLLDHPDEEWFRPPARQAVLKRLWEALGE